MVLVGALIDDRRQEVTLHIRRDVVVERGQEPTPGVVVQEWAIEVQQTGQVVSNSCSLNLLIVVAFR